MVHVLRRLNSQRLRRLLRDSLDAQDLARVYIDKYRGTYISLRGSLISDANFNNCFDLIYLDV